MQNVTLTAEEFNALIAKRAVAVTEREALRATSTALLNQRLGTSNASRMQLRV